MNDLDWPEFDIAENFLELPYVNHWNFIDSNRELKQMDMFMQLPFFEASDNDMAGIPEEDWDLEYEYEMEQMLEEQLLAFYLNRRG